MKWKEEKISEPTGEFAEAIRHFRSALTHVAEREAARPAAAAWLAPAEKRRRGHQHRLVLAWGCAAALCFATTLPFAISSGPGPGPGPAETPHAALSTPARPLAAASSASLLEQVDDQVSQSVPASLAPLAEMDNWNASASPASSLGGGSLDGTSFALMERANAR